MGGFACFNEGVVSTQHSACDECLTAVMVLRRKKGKGYELSLPSGHGSKRPALWERTSKNQTMGAVAQSRYIYNLGEADS